MTATSPHSTAPATPPHPPLLAYPDSWDMLTIILYASLATAGLAILGYGSFKLWQRHTRKPTATTAYDCHQRIMAMAATDIPQIHGEVKRLLGAFLGGYPTTLTETQWPDWLSEHQHTLGAELTQQLAEHLDTSHRLIYAQQVPQQCYKTASLELTTNLITHFSTQPPKV